MQYVAVILLFMIVLSPLPLVVITGVVAAGRGSERFRILGRRRRNAVGSA